MVETQKYYLILVGNKLFWNIIINQQIRKIENFGTDLGLVWGLFGGRLRVVWGSFEGCLGVVLGLVWELFGGLFG